VYVVPSISPSAATSPNEGIVVSWSISDTDRPTVLSNKPWYPSDIKTAAFSSLSFRTTVLSSNGIRESIQPMIRSGSEHSTITSFGSAAT